MNDKELRENILKWVDRNADAYDNVEDLVEAIIRICIIKCKKEFKNE